jgi:hypothetical protein
MKHNRLLKRHKEDTEEIKTLGRALKRAKSMLHFGGITNAEPSDAPEVPQESPVSLKEAFFARDDAAELKELKPPSLKDPEVDPALRVAFADDGQPQEKERLPALAAAPHGAESGDEEGVSGPRGRRENTSLTRIVSVLGRMWLSTNVVNDMIECTINTAQIVLGQDCQVTFYMVPGLVEKLATVPHGGFPVFNLTDSRETVSVYRRSADDGRPCGPPRFNDMTMPVYTRLAICALVQSPVSKEVLGVMQCFHPPPSENDHSREVRMHQLEKKEAAQRGTRWSAKVGIQSRNVVTPEIPNMWNERDLRLLQLISTSTGGMLEQMLGRSHLEGSRTQFLSAFECANSISKAKSLVDFEQRAKNQFANFFGVKHVRVAFYDQENLTFLVSADEVHQDKSGGAKVRRRVDRLEVKGAIGLCVKKRQVVHIKKMCASPILDSKTDGLDKMGRIHPDASMIACPLVWEPDDTLDPSQIRVVGSIQLADKRAMKNGSMVGPPREFTSDDELLLRLMCNVVAIPAWHSIEAMRISARSKGAELTMDQFLVH